MRIFTAGIATETNTFSAMPTSIDDFIVQRDTDSIHRSSLAIWHRAAIERGDDFRFGLNAWAQPSGITIQSAYETLRDEILDKLRAAMPIDIVLLMLHGAMVAQGYDDCEADIVRRVRDIVGHTAVVGVELDLHCHLSESKIAPADIVITYKEYPHTDINARADQLFKLAVAARLGSTRPTMALFDCRMLGLYPTSQQPMREFVDAMHAAEQLDDILAVSLGHGFQFADLPHIGAKVLVVTNNNRDLAQQVAQEFGYRVYALRRQIGFDSKSLPMDTALNRAINSVKRPVVIADQSDNVGAGGPGDSTFVLRWLIDHGIGDVAMAICHDPEVVKAAKKAGEGAQLRVSLGGKNGSSSGDPLDISTTVLSIRCNYVHELRQEAGPPVLFPAGDVVLLRCGSIDIVVSSQRCQCCDPSIFSDLGIDPLRKQLLIPKSTQHFYSAFAPIAGEIIYMAAPGAVPPDPRLIHYRRFDTSTAYPWIDDPLAV